MLGGQCQENVAPRLLEVSLCQPQAMNRLNSIRQLRPTVEPRPDRVDGVIRAVDPQTQFCRIHFRDDWVSRLVGGAYHLANRGILPPFLAPDGSSRFSAMVRSPVGTTIIVPAVLRSCLERRQPRASLTIMRQFRRHLPPAIQTQSVPQLGRI